MINRPNALGCRQARKTRCPRPSRRRRRLSEVRGFPTAPQGAVNPSRARSRAAKGRAIMYAVIKTGGKQYLVAANDVLEIEKLDGEAGSTLEFTDVLMLGEGESVTVGTPLVAGAKVTAELVAQTRGPKLIAFKKRRRKNSRRKKGHRQDLTRVRITDIVGA